ncbi:ABC transporter permease [Maribacter sp. PR1]|uniref:ABC transporter permease n=1 Tax=Maribacter cobaltidurans TaxID=1178778 RepID=A0ABU7IPZ1_9FLAO|nr:MULTISPECIES: ABC transporter permease [Maribacter]MDC6387633.1 ABC transporter permease [Maribacter sp. PR1]MEE1975021.1 ABC transporter permease [Maribacter cobaltidurans]
MHKLLVSAQKEFWLLTRDLGGLAVLFLMPLLLVITITLIQDNTFKSIQENKIPILLVDLDKGEVSNLITNNLKESSLFEIVDESNETSAQDLVQKGDYQLAIILPKNLTKDLNLKIDQNVTGILAEFGVEEKSELSNLKIEKKEIRLYFDPATQRSFKSSVKNNIDKMISKIESQSIYKAFQEELGEESSEPIFDMESFISFNEIVPNTDKQEGIPNSTQHNIPAWSLFAIFFIMLPLSINMVNEKNQGTFIRLRTQPIPYATVLGGKTLVFLVVSLIQFILMLVLGVYLFPVLGLPKLDVTGRIPLLLIVAFFAGLAAIGLGLLLGTIAKSQEQSAPFGATFVVILAAIGGVWVPVFAMPAFMQTLSKLSPMNWGLNAFYDVFLRNVGFSEIIPEISSLLLFFIVTTAIAIIYNQRKNAV